MEEFMGLGFTYYEVILMALTVLVIVVLVLLILLFTVYVKLNRLRKRYVQTMNGTTTIDVESAMITMQDKVRAIEGEQKQTKEAVKIIHGTLAKMKANIGIYKYSAFSEGGSDLSFSVAILDETKDGVVLTGIHSREQAYIYAKPIVKGESKYSLSPEEKEAISRSSLKELQPVDVV